MTHYKAAVRLSSMEPGLNINALPFPISESTIGRFLLGECKLVHIETSDTLSDHFLSIKQIIIDNLKVFPFFVIVAHLYQFFLLFKLIFEFGFLLSKFFLACFSNVNLLQIVLCFFASGSFIVFKSLFFFVHYLE
jgi:hypothetical protein